MACHDLKTTKVGPSYQDVAKKYTDQAEAPAKLAQKVLEGGGGVWGPVAMPANKTMGDTDANSKKLVAWILRLK